MKFFKWINKDNNLRYVETGSTVFFVFIFIFYFYGFRSGFVFRVEDITDIIFDMIIIWVSSTAIIRSFAKLGMFHELDENPDLEKLEQKHQDEINKVNHSDIGKKLKLWNDKQIERKVRDKKNEEINKLKRKRGELENREKVKQRKVNKLSKRIKYLEDDNVLVKVKHHWVTEDEVLTRGVSEGKNKEINTNYSVVKDVTSTQSATVLGSMILTMLIRTALDPSVESWKTLGMFLSIIIPMLVLRAVISYLTSRYKTKYSYKRSVENKITILEFCNKIVDMKGSGSSE